MKKKIKTKTAYKVVYNSGDKFWSYIRNLGIYSCSLRYEIGKTTVPEIGKLFVFENLDDARNFVRFENSRVSILKGIANNLIEIERCCNPFGNFKNFWNKEINADSIFPEVKSPPGSYVCDSFTPKEIVDLYTE